LPEPVPRKLEDTRVKLKSKNPKTQNSCFLLFEVVPDVGMDYILMRQYIKCSNTQYDVSGPLVSPHFENFEQTFNLLMFLFSVFSSYFGQKEMEGLALCNLSL
jgi:hypothetical protein